MTLTLGGCLAVAVALTRSVLPRSLRFLANNSSAELFQLTVLAFCLVNAWISGYLVSLFCFPGAMLTPTPQPPCPSSHPPPPAPFLTTMPFTFPSPPGLYPPCPSRRCVGTPCTTRTHVCMHACMQPALHYACSNLSMLQFAFARFARLASGRWLQAR